MYRLLGIVYVYGRWLQWHRYEDWCGNVTYYATWLTT